MNKYYYTVGLEIHAELKTKTKMFCACLNNPDEEKPNTNICPVCMAHPGALPVPNKKAIEGVIKVGLALGSTIADFSEFDRKNYFYPDIPKGYQISQFKYPIVSGGNLANMDITRIHLEEDTGNNKHFDKDGGYSLIDFNRAGVPLMELVTEPHTFEDPEEAAKVASNFAKEYQLLLWYLGASDANMEKGEMRVEANVSVSTEKGVLSPRYVEVKNLNSFKVVEKAIKYEYERMIELIEAGRESEIVKETRGFDEAKQKTISQRKKEGAADYRYFPDPDLPKMYLHEAFDLEKMKSELGELPVAKRARYKNDFGIKEEDTEVYINDPALAEWFEKVAGILNDVEAIKLASNYITSDYMGLKKTNPDVKLTSPENFAELIKMAKEGYISSRATKDILGRIVINDESPKKIAEENNLIQSNDEGALKTIVEKIISESPEVVAIYKGGKENAIMSLVGKIIKESNGSANPQIVIKLLKEMLK
ncbi:MAG: aspartyl-tRNA(Asn)/glutamyl-tRNA(Gln) amidotransferase subunit [Patescibacteria group bacterium]|nr:aspartyl-tRNA(Asn)/glutamyl-tRNA(Gln) amidotransferase subunit [Patescibacteria group bacterium]